MKNAKITQLALKVSESSRKCQQLKIDTIRKKIKKKKKRRGHLMNNRPGKRDIHWGEKRS